MPRSPHVRASLALAERDPILASLVAAHGPMRLPLRPPVARRFEALARSIAFQQLAGGAARTIWGRVRATVAGDLDAQAVLAVPVDQLRAAGLSRAKVAALHDLAARVASGDIRLDRAGRMADDEVVAMLTRARGIGPWTAQMFLLFSLGRLDVWPTGDLGVRVGFGRAWGLDETPPAKELERAGEPFRPYRSVVAWYCWRAADAVNGGEPT